MIRVIAAALLAGISAVAAAQAPANPTVRIRGTVESLEGQNLTVKARNGESMKVVLPDNAVVMGIVKASPADIANGHFIGSATLGERDGALIAREVHIFPENMRGTGEGHRDWDLGANSKMTNANVAQITNMGDGRVMTVQYRGGEKKILITPETQVVSYTPANRSELKPGAPVFINSERQPDGTLKAPRVNVGLKGQVPPM
jgi:hypothetical protein